MEIPGERCLKIGGGGLTGGRWWSDRREAVV